MNKHKITAFHGIFEDKLTKLVKHIKKIRKDPSSTSKVKQLLTEARELKKLLKQDKIKPATISIEIDYEIIDGKIVIKETSSRHKFKTLETRCVGGLIIVEFNNSTL